MPELFDQQALLKKRHLVANTKSYQGHFLIKHIHANIVETFASFAKQFDNILLIGAISEDVITLLRNKAKKHFIIADISSSMLKNYPEYQTVIIKNEQVDLNQKFDLIFSFLDLHHINNVPQYLISIKNLLNPDGVFMSSFFGEENLKNLRQSFIKIEGNKNSPHIFPYIDIKTIAHLLIKAGFNEPIADLDKINIEYDNVMQLFYDIKTIAETNILTQRKPNFVQKDFIQKLDQELKQGQKTFDIQVEIINCICHI